MGEISGIGDDLFDDILAADLKGRGDVIHYFAYDLPYPFAYRQFPGVLTDVLEKSADGLVGGEASGDGEYVVLDEGDGGMGDLGGEVPGLAFPESQVLLGFLENHLDGPSHGVDPIGRVEVKGSVGRDDSAPGGALGAAHVEQPYRDAVHKGVHREIAAPVETACPDGILSGGVSRYQCLGGELLAATPPFKGKAQGSLPHPYHSEIMASDAACRDELQDLPACEPAVGQEVIEPAASLYRPSDHILEKLYLASGIVGDAVRRRGVLPPVLLDVPAPGLLVRQGMRPLPARLSDELVVDDHLAPSVADGEHQGLEAEYHPVGDMAEHPPDVFGVYAPLWIIGVIHYGAYRSPRTLAARLHPSPELPRDVVRYPAPVEAVVVHEAVEDILARTAYRGQTGFGIVIWIPDHHARKGDEDGQYPHHGVSCVEPGLLSKKGLLRKRQPVQGL